MISGAMLALYLVGVASGEVSVKGILVGVVSALVEGVRGGGGEEEGGGGEDTRFLALSSS